jgi:hypothetical protein
MINVYATSVVSYINKEHAIAGDIITLTIRASGKNVQLPNINTINNTKIISQSSSTQMSIVNSQVSNIETKQYRFIASETMTIKPFVVKVDNKEYKTQEHKIIVKPVSASKDGDDLQLKLILDKQDNIYVGEAIKATLVFKYKSDIEIAKLDLDEFKPDHFVVKPLKSSPAINENEYNILKQEYIIFPQIAGKLTIKKHRINVSQNTRSNSFFAQLNTTRVYSNDIVLDVKQLPNNIHIQGDYTIDANIDKHEVDSNKPINYTITIKGYGNIDDIDPFELKLDDEVVYTTKPEIKTYIKDDKYGGEFVQKFSIVAQNDFHIPSIEFKYFDQLTKSTKVLKTKEYDIKVRKLNRSTPKIETKNTNNQIKQQIIRVEESSTTRYIYAIFGLLIGVLLTYVFLNRSKNKVKIDRPIDIQIKKAKSDKALYEVLLPYSNQKDIQDIMKLLEDNIYNGAKHKINRKSIDIK